MNDIFLNEGNYDKLSDFEGYLWNIQENNIILLKSVGNLLYYFSAYLWS